MTPTRDTMPRQTQPVELAVAPETDVPALPVLCDGVGRNLRAIAGRLERAALDLAGPANATNGPRLALGHQDVWRCEMEIAAAVTDLRATLAEIAAWRRQRDADVEQATREAMA